MQNLDPNQQPEGRSNGEIAAMIIGFILVFLVVTNFSSIKETVTSQWEYCKSIGSNELLFCHPDK